MYTKNKRGQSTVEYILLVTAVIAVLIAFATNKSGPLQTQLNSTMGQFSNEIGDVASHYVGGHVSPAGGTGSPAYNVDVTPPNT